MKHKEQIQEWSHTHVMEKKKEQKKVKKKEGERRKTARKTEIIKLIIQDKNMKLDCGGVNGGKPLLGGGEVSKKNRGKKNKYKVWAFYYFWYLPYSDSLR